MSKGVKTTVELDFLSDLVKKAKQLEETVIEYGWDDSVVDPRTGESNAQKMYWFEHGTYRDGAMHQPPRPLMEQTSIWMEDEQAEQSVDLLMDCVFNKSPIRAAVKNMAEECKVNLDNNMTVSTTFLERNADSTIEQKGENHPSVWTGSAQDNIKTWVYKKV